MSSIRKQTSSASYLPPDANCLLSVFDHCLRSRHYVNVVVAGKHALAAMAHDGGRQKYIARKASAFGKWASNDQDSASPTW